MLITMGGEQAANGRTYTMRDLSQRTAQVIEQINESGQQALITKHGRIVALITPMERAEVESIVLSQGPISNEVQKRIDEESGYGYTSEEVAERLRGHNGEASPAPATKPRRNSPRSPRS